MQRYMKSHIEELLGGAIAFLTYNISHCFNIQLIDANVMHTGFDLGNKFINMILGVITACLGYLAVWSIKKYITKEIK